jgi:hypothetical protein
MGHVEASNKEIFVFLKLSSIRIPGISDHDIVATDIETKPHYQKTNPRKCYIYSKANWKDLIFIVAPVVCFLALSI